jgi:hypothetical protein
MFVGESARWSIAVIAVPATSGSPGTPAGNSTIQELDLGWIQLAAAALLPRGVDPHSEGEFAL